jgi:hypothetical protein
MSGLRPLAGRMSAFHYNHHHHGERSDKPETLLIAFQFFVTLIFCCRTF